MPQPPSFQPRARNPRVGPLNLPGEGRQGEAPPWPLPGKATPAEREAWRQLWATPQAWAWELLGWTRSVGRYCRVMVAAEMPGASPPLLAQATALEDRLGLTPKAMRLLLWQIDGGAAAEQPAEGGNVASIEQRRKRLADAGR